MKRPKDCMLWRAMGRYCIVEYGMDHRAALKLATGIEFEELTDVELVCELPECVWLNLAEMNHES